MSEANNAEKASTSNSEVKLSSVFAFKEGMTTVYTEAGEAVPVTVLRFDPWVVSQIKTKEKDGYEAIQVACAPKKQKNTDDSEKGHFKKAGLEGGFQFVREVRQSLPEGLTLGSRVAISSLEKGQMINLTGISKGHGFAGAMKRWNLAGGPDAHGSKFHRRPGSSGNRTWPGRVMPGKKFPGHWGVETVTVKNIQVVDVLPEQNAILVKGAVPGSRNSLIRLMGQ